MDITEEPIYMAADAELTEFENEGCYKLLYSMVEEVFAEQNKEITEGYIRPHLSVARIITDVARLQLQLMSTRDVLTESIETDEAAGDQVLRVQDLLRALEDIGGLLNRTYYGACKLVLDLDRDDELYETMVKTAERMVEDAIEKAKAD